MHHDAFATLVALKSTLDDHLPLAPGLLRNLRKDMVLRYTYHSNAIEGNALTLTETKVVLEDGLTIGGKLLRHHLEAVNHADAITHLENLAKENVLLDESVLKDLHQLVLRGLDNEAGRYRGCNVIISGAGHTPPDHLHVGERMQCFFDWYRGDAQSLHPVERAARVHTDLVIIHPFRDGNGRTSRLAMNLELMRAGFPTAIVPVDDRLAYFQNLDKAGKDADYGPFVQQLGQLVEQSFEPYWYLLGLA
ncbi:Fic family protein [Desulfomicrobium baculatum]|uniref:Filamentation induced by cAMP protein Fic n=1 Tax=Desulfomicrobium baculatum (strain DSM 4028 / VKM B-1378 / X) TaxID=525897 RepID=C7LRV3_DESBD|nr:Fic family protein [Desulfomicrobium baculatum]ACU89336.1 filamentation induced by cAMP protein Fic [Desulfomicrobium baculatum DSM 4028]